jgi:2-dehydropantoate 2-reductase
MRIAILGAGAIGGLAGAYLTKAGYDLVLVDKNAAHVQAMRENGLYINGVRGELKVVPVKVSTPGELNEPLEWLIIATKSQHTEEALAGIRHLITPQTVIMSLQNGFNADWLVEQFGVEQVLAAVPNYGGAYLNPGQLEFVHEGPVEIGEMSRRTTERLRWIGEAFEQLTRVVLTENIEGHIWSKACYGARVIVSSLVNEPGGKVMQPVRSQLIAGAIIRETLDLAEAAGVRLEPFDFFEPILFRPKTAADTRRLLNNVRHATQLLSGHKEAGQYQYIKKGSGIWWDIVYRQRKSEVEALMTPLLTKAEQLGVEVPLTRKLCQMIYEIEAGERALGWDNLDELNQYIHELHKELPFNGDES